MDDGTAGREKSYNFLADVSMLCLSMSCTYFSRGWTFDDYYFRSFGLDPKFLDVSFHDTLVKGFTIIFTGVLRLRVCYLALLLIPPLLNVSRTRPWAKVLCMAALFLALLPLIYLISRSAGERKAAVDKGPMSTLSRSDFHVCKPSLDWETSLCERGFLFHPPRTSRG